MRKFETMKRAGWQEIEKLEIQTYPGQISGISALNLKRKNGEVMHI